VISIAWFIPVIYFSLLLGMATTITTWIMHDKRNEKRLKEKVLDSESWCQQNCKNYEWCYSNYKDPDDAFDALEDLCISCPMSKAMAILERDQQIKRGKK
jgi:hypothetical protein